MSTDSKHAVAQVTVYEGDCIYSKTEEHPDWVDDNSYTALSDETFAQLRNFVEEKNEELRRQKRDDDEDDPVDIMSPVYNRKQKTYILRVGSYVGSIITPSGVTVEILPKIARAGESDTEVERARVARTVVMKMLRYLLHIDHKRATQPHLDSMRMPIHEIFIEMFAEEVEDVVKQGLKSGYVPQDANRRAFKGKLLVAQDIRMNCADRSRVFTRHAAYMLDIPENRLIKATLLHLMRVTRNGRNKMRIKRLLAEFASVETLADPRADFARVVRTRESMHYKLALAWARVFLNNESFTSFTGKTTSYALLFPMFRLFEAFVPAMMRRCITPSLSLSTQGTDNTKYLLNKYKREGAGPGSGVSQLKPDIVVKRDGEPLVVFDTKWKVLGAKSSKPGSGDLYQIFAYGKRYGVKRVVLVYPCTEGVEAGIGSRYGCWAESSGEPEFTVETHFVDLALLAERGKPDWECVRELADGIEDSTRS